MTVPAWWLIIFPVFAVLMIVQNYFATQQIKALRDLFELYIRERDALVASTPSEGNTR